MLQSFVHGVCVRWCGDGPQRRGEERRCVRLGGRGASSSFPQTTGC